jgi:Tol biopolymer transport system component
MTGDRQPVPFLQTPANEALARISPDGKWLAYTSNESGPLGVFVTRFPAAGGKWQVSTKGGTFPMWSRDGRELFYFDLDGALMAVPVKSGAEFEAGVPVRLFTPNASVGGVGIGTFYDVAADGRFLVNLHVETTAPPAVVILDWKPPLTPAP